MMSRESSQNSSARAAAALASMCMGACSGGFQLTTDTSIDAGPTITAGALCATPSEIGDLPDYPKGFHVVGNQIQDSVGNPIILRGVNRSGSEYRCIRPGGGFFDGACDDSSVRVMASWK